jgi:hypothetical protein
MQTGTPPFQAAPPCEGYLEAAIRVAWYNLSQLHYSSPGQASSQDWNSLPMRKCARACANGPKRSEEPKKAASRGQEGSPSHDRNLARAFANGSRQALGCLK